MYVGMLSSHHPLVVNGQVPAGRLGAASFGCLTQFMDRTFSKATSTNDVTILFGQQREGQGYFLLVSLWFPFFLLFENRTWD